jgi:hypothetical protein
MPKLVLLDPLLHDLSSGVICLDGTQLFIRVLALFLVYCLQYCLLHIFFLKTDKMEKNSSENSLNCFECPF